jgi:hypothetical protein
MKVSTTYKKPILPVRVARK